MNKLCRNGFVFLLACLAAALPAHAIDYTWTGLSTTDFNMSGNWDPEGVPNSNDDTALIQDGLSNLGTSNTVSTLTLGAGSTSGTINLNSGGNLTASQVIQSGTGTGTVNFNGGTITASAASTDFLSGTANHIYSGGATIDTQIYSVTISTVLNDPIAIPGGLTKLGAGTLSLSAANTYAGPTVISAGVLQADDGVGLPAGSLLRLDGGVLQTTAYTFTRNIGTLAGNVQWTANGGGFSAGSAGGLQVTLNGGATLVWGTDIQGTLKLNTPTSAGSVTITNNIDLGDTDRTIEVDYPSTSKNSGNFSGTISGTGGIIKNGPGRLMMYMNKCLYTGTTTLNDGFFANYAAVDPITKLSYQSTGKYVVNGGTMCFCGLSPDSIAGLKITGGEVEGLGASILYSKTDYDIQGGELYGITLANGPSTVVGLTKTGASVATLECTCTYTGTTFISEGTLALNTTSDGSYTGQISTSSLIENNATFLIADTNAHTIGTITGTGTTQLNDGAQLTASSMAQGTVTIGAGATLTIAAIAGGPTSGADLLSPVPEPNALVLLATAGLGVLLAAVCRKKR